MYKLKICCEQNLKNLFSSKRQIVTINDELDYIDIAAIVINSSDLYKIEQNKIISNLKIPIISPDLILFPKDKLSNYIEEKASLYEDSIISPYTKSINFLESINTLGLCCPGHHGLDYYKKHPSGNIFLDVIGKGSAKIDYPNMYPELGDILTHYSTPFYAEVLTQKVFNSDRSMYIYNGTTTTNLVICGTILTEGDLVLFDKNNYKSIIDGALINSRAIPLYLETEQNIYGIYGGIKNKCYEEEYIKAKIKKLCPEKLKSERPIRLAIIQNSTEDGIIYNIKYILEKIGKLCDYIFFDMSFFSHGQFMSMFKDFSPLLINYNENDPGIFISNALYYHMGGLSQTAQLHKKDSHIKGQKRYIDNKILQNSYLHFSSTSPYIPFLNSIELVSKLHEGSYGNYLWDNTMNISIYARKEILKKCKFIKVFQPSEINGKKWEDYPTEFIANNIEFFKLNKNDKWHGFNDYIDNQYFIDPMKLVLITSDINNNEEFGIPSRILYLFLKENLIFCEKSNYYSILFLLNSSITTDNMDRLINKLIEFEDNINKNEKIENVLPNFYQKYKLRYKDYTLKNLCNEMNNFYINNKICNYTKILFNEENFPETAMSSYIAQNELMRGNYKLIKICDIIDKIALESIFIYPGPVLIVPGQKWNIHMQKYFLLLEEFFNKFPGFHILLNGIYLINENDKIIFYSYIYNKNN